MGITEPFEFANRYLFESFSFFLFNPTMKLSVMLLGLRLLLAHSATMHEENDKSRNANRQNEDAQDNIVENEKTTIDEQIRDNKFSEISDERKENAASKNRQRMQKIPLKLKKHATSRQMLFTPFEKHIRSTCETKCSKDCLPLLAFFVHIPYLICLGECAIKCG